MANSGEVCRYLVMVSGSPSLDLISSHPQEEEKLSFLVLLI